MTSWTKPRTWVAGQTVAAAALNTDLRDDLLNIDERLDLQGITSESALNQVKAALCGVRCNDSGTQSINASTDEALTWNAEDHDSDGFHDTSSNTSRITIPAGLGGYYLVSVGLRWANGPGYVRLWVEDDTGAYLGRQIDMAAATGFTQQTLTFLTPLSAGDWIIARCRHDDAGSVTVNKNLASTFFAAYRIFAT